MRSRPNRGHQAKLAVPQRSAHRRVRPDSEPVYLLSASARRWPAEWQPHEATWIAWPHEASDWPGKFESIPWVYAEIVRTLHRSEPVRILCQDEEAADRIESILASHRVDPVGYVLHPVPTDRSWLRDSAPTAVVGADGLEWIGWTFNGWAKYENYDCDRLVPEAVAELSGRPLVRAERPDGGGPLVLEGGGIETNGKGALLVTEEWLLSDAQVRNPGMDRTSYEAAFQEYLGIDRVVWLGEGCVGDDTHGHVDDVARFVDPNTVVLSIEPDPADENHARMADNLDRLVRAGRDWPGGLRVVELPFPRPLIMDGERLPASYANFYVANEVVLVPTFNDPSDRTALATLAELFPGREVVGIHAVDLVWGLGTLHCLTQQEPRVRR